MTNRPGGTSRSLAEEGFRLRESLDSIRCWLRSHVVIDTRALAALRIALGGIVLIDLYQRAGSLELFYAGGGVYPLSVHEAAYGPEGTISLYAISDAPWVQGVLFAIAAACAFAFVLGYRTRLVGAVSLVLLVSLHVRNPAVLNGGDRLLRVLLFVALLTPLGERWSVDSLRRGSARRQIASVATAALLVQPIVVFTLNAIEKRRGEHWYAGDALELALSDGTMTTDLGAALLEFPTLLWGLNYAWVVLLAGGIPFLLLSTRRWRALSALAYVTAFAGMELTLSVGLFPPVLAASVLPFLTAPFWNGLERRVPSGRSAASVTAESLGPLGSTPIERRLLASLETRGYESAISRGTHGIRILSVVAGVAVLVWILAFAAVDVVDADPPPPMDSEHLDQQDWGLYAPDPAPTQRWHVVAVEFEDGSTVNPASGEPVSVDRPPNAAAAYESFRHRSFLTTVDRTATGDANDAMANRFAEWACDRAADRGPSKVDRVSIQRFQQSKSPGGTSEERISVTIIDQACE